MESNCFKASDEVTCRIAEFIIEVSIVSSNIREAIQ